MSYTYLQEQGEESSAASFADIPAFVLSRLNITPAKSYCSASGTASSQSFQSGTTLPHSTESHGADTLTSCVEDSRVRTSAQPERAQDSTASEAASGLKCLGSLARFDLDSRLWKTHQFSLLGGLESFSETWPRWGMMRGGECWELSTPELRTRENESGLWRTPTVGMLNADRAKDPEYGQRKLAKGQTITLADQVKDSRMWPTPTRNDAVGAGYQRANGNHYFTLPGAVGATKHLPPEMEEKRMRMYPTPGANEDSYRLGGNSQQLNSLGAIARREALAESPESGGQLNPTWVEWLMGWPLGWTDSAQSATAKFQQWLRSHGIPSNPNPFPKSTVATGD